MNYQFLKFDVDGAVATITLNRPERLNALDMAMGQELVLAVERARDDGEVRAVVITGSGRAFCAGGDLAAMRANIEAGGDPRQFLLDLTRLFHPAIVDLRIMPKPVVAAINGAAGGAGFSLALVCDLRVMAQSAKLRQAYTSVGLVPDGGMTAFLPRIVGLGAASELVFLDTVLDAGQALRLGLVHRVVPDDQVLPAVQEMAARLAAGPTAAFARAKALLNRSMLPFLESQLEAERQAIGSAAATQDFREGLAAFFEKRSPKYEGR